MTRTVVLSVTVAALALLALAGPAPAAPITLTYQGKGLGIWGKGSPESPNNGFSVTGFSGSATYTGFVGQLEWSAPGLGDFIAFCMDASTPMDAVQAVTVRPLSDLPDGNNPPNVQPLGGARAAWLMNTYGAWQPPPLVNPPVSNDPDTHFAALQIAIWEVLYEPFATGYNLKAGTFQETELGSHIPMIYWANYYLGRLGSNTADGIWLDTTSGGQDLGMPGNPPPPIPEPASILLLGTGLAALARARRRC